jgi:NAD+ diphosphatase
VSQRVVAGLAGQAQDAAAMEQQNYYTGVGLDRLTERRIDADWIARRLGDPQARLVPMWQLKALVIDGETPEPVFLAAAECQVQETLRVFLGEAAGVPYFALELSHLDEADIGRLVNGRGAFQDLRALGPRIDRQNGALLAYARGMMYWHSRHRFCGVCGSPTRSEQAGHIRQCTNAACNATHFPRTDPAVIMLVTYGDQCLLGRQQPWPKGQHSTLAGFVEPGESLEDAVRREVREEAAVELDEVRYHSSQPWPFPASIMLGFTATAASLDYRINTDELEGGQWFSRDFLRATHDPEVFRLPRPDSIARRLIEDWMKGNR